jgi:glycolate oxidase iron-sulfur subunit
VHCGFCTATCPTYQLLGDELDGPRGRIYLIKQVLEGAPVTRKTQLHLDRCLTCRNCETSCPSGVQYGELLEIGRAIVDERVPRPGGERTARWALEAGLTSPLFGAAVKLGKLTQVPPASGPRARLWPTREHKRKVLLLLGCVQPALMPNVNSATARVLDAAGIQTLVADGAGCCGAIPAHLGKHEAGLADMRRNIDAWWPLVQGLTSQGRVEAIVMNASGCGVTVKNYGHALAHDPDYAEKARRVSELTRDLSELLPDLVPALQPRLARRSGSGPGRRVVRLAYHPPCTLQHGQQLRGGVETHLGALGFEISVPASESQMCCGSAGTYSLLQPELAGQLRDRKLGHLAALQAQVIVSANVGCIHHLQTGTTTPVRHWVEVLDEALAG